MKYDPQFLIEIVIAYLQPVEWSLKQTFLLTLPSSTVGWASTNHPDQSVLHLYAGTRVVEFLYQQPLQNDTIP